MSRFTLYTYASTLIWARPSMPVGFGTIADACEASKALRTSVEVRSDSGEVVGWARARGEWSCRTCPNTALGEPCSHRGVA